MTARLPSKQRLYWETLRHLKLVQFTGRIKRMLWRQRLDLTPFAGSVRTTSTTWVRHAARSQSQFGASRFRFLSVDGDIDNLGWDNPTIDKLWRYNLHYFDDFAATDADQKRDWHHTLIHRWISENPPCAGSGWEPYPTSIRIVNWVKAGLSGFDLGAIAQNHLALQGRWLFQNLEYHLLGNHLMTNAKALLFAGHYFEGKEAAQWRAKGAALLIEQLHEQILPDGGHFELSPMYHALALEDILDVYNLIKALPVSQDAQEVALTNLLRSKIAPMRRWLQAMTHPDGRLAHFNDCAQGIAPTNGALEDYAMRLGLDVEEFSFSGITQLLDSGYVRVDQADAVAIADVGHIGPDYLPGHAHADTLSFELSVHNERIFVNRGTSVYGTGSDRLTQRSTASHNTLTYNGHNSSEVWSGFRVARRAKPTGLTIIKDGDIEISCAHDGYRRFAAGPYHRRKWSFGDCKITVSDALIEGEGSAIAHFHLHPDCTLHVEQDGYSGTIATMLGTVIEWQSHETPAQDMPSCHNPEFGISKASSMLSLLLINGTSSMTFSWKPRP